MQDASPRARRPAGRPRHSRRGRLPARQRCRSARGGGGGHCRMMGGWHTVGSMWRPWKRHRLDVEAIVSALDDAVGRIGASADKIIAALQAAGTGGTNTDAAVAALNATSDRIDAAVAVASPPAAGTASTEVPPPA